MYHTFNPDICQNDKASSIEILAECFNNDKADFNNKESNAISMIMARYQVEKNRQIKGSGALL